MLDNIYLTGFMGSGKSTVGPLLAKALGCEFVDLDLMIERSAGMDIGEVFDRRGETGFRNMETEFLKRAAATDGRVIAIGGGCITKKYNRDLMKKTGRVVYLKISEHTAMERLRNGSYSRPLLRSCRTKKELQDELGRIMRQRKIKYSTADVILRVDDMKPEEIVDDIMAKMNCCKTINVPIPTNGYDIILGNGIFDDAALYINRIVNDEKRKKAFVIADSKLGKASRSIVMNLKDLGWECQKIDFEIDGGFKDFKNVYQIYGRLHEMGADRKSVIIAIGGGNLGDVAGFVASTYMRGLKWVYFPTTLLSQVDSAIGGKTGVDHEFGKNLIGSFYQPLLVICDTSFIKTLSKRDMVSGLAEMIKYGLVCDKSLYKDLQNNWETMVLGRYAEIHEYIERCVRLKIGYVKDDVDDTSGYRANLNFGHTFGHALENVTCYKYFRHGEAVIWGMRFAVAISLVKGLLDKEDAIKIDECLRLIPVPKIPESMSMKNLLNSIKGDKKRLGKEVEFVLLKGIGKAISGESVDVADLKEVYRMITRGGVV